MMSPAAISDHIIAAILAQRLQPGARLVETQLAALFAVSRTQVRESLHRLVVRGVVQAGVRGWSVVEPTPGEAQQAFLARRVIEVGLLHHLDRVEPRALDQLRDHLRREQATLAGTDIAARSFLLGDFHVCMAECLGNALLADTLRDLTARTTLMAMLYQSTHHAQQSCAEHADIVGALARGDLALAGRLMDSHIRAVEQGLQLDSTPDPLQQLRLALQPFSNPFSTCPPSKE